MAVAFDACRKVLVRAGVRITSPPSNLSTRRKPALPSFPRKRESMVIGPGGTPMDPRLRGDDDDDSEYAGIAVAFCACCKCQSGPG
jgi:hypothetical protein